MYLRQAGSNFGKITNNCCSAFLIFVTYLYKKIVQFEILYKLFSGLKMY